MERSPGHDLLPPGFADQLARLIRPGDGEAAAGVLSAAAALDDEQLAGFLERLAARIRRAPEPLTAEEMHSLLAGR